MRYNGYEMISLQKLLYVIQRQNDHCAFLKKSDYSVFQDKGTNYPLFAVPLCKT